MDQTFEIERKIVLPNVLKLLSLAFFVIPFSALAQSEVSVGDWAYTDRMGVKSASTWPTDDTFLMVNCVHSSPFGTSDIEVQISGEPQTGAMSFTFDAEPPISVLPVNGVIASDCPECARKFSRIVAKLKQASLLLVRSDAGLEAQFSLRGSSKAIGDCPVKSK